MTSAPDADWDPCFARRSPMFDACAPIAERWQTCRSFPDREHCAQALAANAMPVLNRDRRPVVLVDPDLAAGAGAFERAVAESGQLGLRENSWHDLMNLLVWCVFPQSKAALNAAHVEDLAAEGVQTRRSALRDALTVFDENGVAVACADPLLEDLLREFRWRELFVEHRTAVRRSMRFLVFGHGLLDKARAPFVGLTGHACILPVTASRLDAEPLALARSLDAELAQAVRALQRGRDLAPLPVLGVPGWWPANELPAFYCDRNYFRPGRIVR